MTEVSSYRSAPYDRLTVNAVAPVDRAYNGEQYDGRKPYDSSNSGRSISREQDGIGTRIDFYA